MKTALALTTGFSGGFVAGLALLSYIILTNKNVRNYIEAEAIND